MHAVELSMHDFSKAVTVNHRTVHAVSLSMHDCSTSTASPGSHNDGGSHVSEEESDTGSITATSILCGGRAHTHPPCQPHTVYVRHTLQGGLCVLVQPPLPMRYARYTSTYIRTA